MVLFDDDGTEEEVVFRSRREFEGWAGNNTLKASLPDGRKMFINAWDLLQHGGRYYTCRRLEKTVSGIFSYCSMPGTCMLDTLHLHGHRQ